MITFTKEMLKNDDINCLALCIYSEARGEPTEGQYWVGHVVLNRVKDKSFPNTIYGVVFQKFQFSWTINKNSFIVKEMNSWNNCVNIAKELINGKPDETNNALYFLTTNLTTSWSKKLKVRKIIGNHKFLGN